MNFNVNFEWNPDTTTGLKFKEISNTKKRNLGLSEESKKMVNDFKELKENPPNIIIATPIKTFKFMQNYSEHEQTMFKRGKYVMGLGVFQQLFCDVNNPKTKLLKPASIKFKNVHRPYNGENLDNKSLLVFRTGGIGDLLFIQPNLRYLKEKYPTCEIFFACGPQYQSMVKNWDCVDEVLDLPFTFERLRDADYHSLFEGVIERCKLAESVNSYNLFTEWMGLNLPNELLIPKQEAVEEKVDFCRQILSQWNLKEKGFIVTQLRASSPIRTPRPAFWIELINKLTDRGYKILLTDSPRQAEHVDGFIKFLKNKELVFNFCKHSPTLDYTIALTSLAKGVIATDSALNHIAASLDVPCYGIYGPFPGRIRLSTYPKAKWVDAVRDCAPCFIHSPLPCPKAGPDKFSPCYDNINIDQIIPEIEELFND